MKTISALILLLLLSACAAPRYQNVKRYETAAAAETCLASCVQQEAACKAQCQTRRETCAQSLEPEIGKHYEEALKRYDQALRYYSLELERYRHALLLGWGWGPHGHAPWVSYGWIPPQQPAAPPPAPTREGEQARLVAERCDQDCGCYSGYDACYTGCGGRIVVESRCVAHCP